MVRKAMNRIWRYSVAVIVSFTLVVSLLPAIAVGDEVAVDDALVMDTSLLDAFDGFGQQLSSVESERVEMSVMSLEEEAIVAQSNDSVIEITPGNGETSPLYSLEQGQELRVNFSVSGVSSIGFSISQTPSISTGDSFKATLKHRNGSDVFNWNIPAGMKTYTFGPMVIDSGQYTYRFIANCDVSLKIISATSSVNKATACEIEPNDSEATATPIEFGVSYIAGAYDPNGEVYLPVGSGSMQGLNDLDVYSFHVDTPSNVAFQLATEGSMHYEVTRSLSQVAFKQGNTSSGSGKTTTVDCGKLEPGTYYLAIQSGSVWKKPYVLQVAAIVNEITRVELSQTEFEYSDKAGYYARPTVTAWAGNVKVAENVEVGDYSPNIRIEGDRYARNVGTYTVTVTGRGDYEGTARANFTIKPREITRIVLGTTRYTYYSDYPTAKYPWVEIYCGVDKVETVFSDAPEEENFIVEYPDNPVLPGTYNLTVRAFGNYTGTLKASYSIIDPNNPGNTGGSSSGSSNSNNNSGGSSNTQTSAKSVTMLRLYNPNTGEHLFTSDTNEKNTLVRLGWRYEGQGWKAPTSGNPVYRLYNPNTGEHHFTMDKHEYDSLQPLGWKGEGRGWYSDSNKGVPIYRLYNKKAPSYYHHYTTDMNERSTLTRGSEWVYEGEGWYGVK